MTEIRKENCTSPSNTLSIAADTFFDAGKKYGAALKKDVDVCIKIFRSQSVSLKNTAVEKAKTMLQFMDNSRNNPVFTVGRMNVMAIYLDLFYGYCEGACISTEEGALLQTELASGCQTLFVQDVVSHSIGFLHAEENVADQELAKLYHYAESHPHWNPTQPLPDSIESLYQYKIVDMNIASHSFTFFAYPQLCFGGPTTGYTAKTRTIIAVDTITPTYPFVDHSIWANAITSMLLLLGDIDLIRSFLFSLRDAHISITHGYAIHLAQADTHNMTSFEIGGYVIEEITPIRHCDRLIITRVNFPHSIQLQQSDELNMDRIKNQPWDIWDAQTSLEMRLRESNLHQICTNTEFVYDTSLINQLNEIMYTCPGDIETDYFEKPWKTFTGLLSPSLAGYTTGIFSKDHAIIEFGKLYPYLTTHPRPKLWYAPGDSLPKNSIDLYKEAEKKYKNHI